MEEDPMLRLSQEDWDDLFVDEVQPDRPSPPRSDIFAEDESHLIYSPDGGSFAMGAMRSFTGRRYAYRIDKKRISSCTPLPKNFRLDRVNGIIKIIDDPDQPLS